MESRSRSSRLACYLDDKRRLFADTYQTNCLTIAKEIARLLLEDGRQPFIACLHKEEPRFGSIFHFPLMPVRYRGGVTFTKHYVCCCDGLVYDPLLEVEIEIERYSQAVFGEDFPVEKYVSEEVIEEYLGVIKVME